MPTSDFDQCVRPHRIGDVDSELGNVHHTGTDVPGSGTALEQLRCPSDSAPGILDVGYLRAPRTTDGLPTLTHRSGIAAAGACGRGGRQVHGMEVRVAQRRHVVRAGRATVGHWRTSGAGHTRDGDRQRSRGDRSKAPEYGCSKDSSPATRNHL
jgi:hypothetical protein